MRTLRLSTYTKVLAIPSSNCFVSASLFLCTSTSESNPCAQVKSSQEHNMARTGVTAAPGQVGTVRADRSKVGSEVRDTAIRSKYKAVRSATSALAAHMSAEDQMV